MGLTLDIRYVDELYNATPEIYFEIIDSQTVGSVMLVGHNPAGELTLEALIGHDALLRASPGGFPPAGLAVLDFDNSSASWKLTDFLRD
jgi:phosphohistidine phosphatase